MARKNEYTLLDNTDMDKTYPYEDYVEYCEGEEIKPNDDCSQDFYDWQQDTFEWDKDAFWDIVRLIDRHCVITGTLGLWTGRHDIEPKVFHDAESAINACLTDCDYVKIVKRFSSIFIQGIHHDGTNNFELRFLSDKGLDRYLEHGECSVNNRENILTLPAYLDEMIGR